MSIIDFFDIKNYGHLSSWMYLMDNGVWPDDFKQVIKENNLTFPTGWNATIVHKMANSYCQIILTNKNIIWT